MAEKVLIKGQTDLHKSERHMARLFIALPVIGFCIFTLATLVFVFVMSLFDYNVYRDEYEYIGFTNFTDLFANATYSDAFFDSILNTLFMLLGVPIGMIEIGRASCRERVYVSV